MEVNVINGAAAPPASFTAEAKLPVVLELTHAVQAVNGAKLFGQDSELSFIMDRQSKRFVVRLVDKTTRKVIRQIPAEDVLRQAGDLLKQ